MTTIAALREEDRADWDRLWQAYLVYYESTLALEVTADAFRRLVAGEALHGAIARDAEGRAIGFVHWLHHPSTWSTASSCYLEDLFVDPSSRRSGAGRALIEHVAGQAAAAGADKVYWLTQEGNVTARALYDRVAGASGFVHYERSLPPAASLA